jgi:hypothetical protein
MSADAVYMPTRLHIVVMPSLNLPAQSFSVWQDVFHPIFVAVCCEDHATFRKKYLRYLPFYRAIW